jgi:hypothetical protein
VGLHIGKISAEKLLGPLDGDVFNHIHALTAAVIASAGVSLGVFVGEYGPGSGQNSGADDIFGSNQLNVLLLTLEFCLNSVSYFRIDCGKELHCVLNHVKTPSGANIKTLDMTHKMM